MLLAAGVGFDVAGGLGLAQGDGEQDVVKLLLPCGHHRGDGGEGFAAGGGFIGGERAVVLNVSGGDAAGEVVIVVGLILANRQVGQMALLLLAAHEGENGIADLALVKLGLASLVEILGGSAQILVDEIINRLVGLTCGGATISSAGQFPSVGASRTGECRSDGKLAGAAALIVEAEVAVITVLNHDFPQSHGDGFGLELESVRVKGVAGLLRRGLGKFREEEGFHRCRQGRRCLRRGGDAGFHNATILAPITELSTVATGDGILVTTVAIFG